MKDYRANRKLVMYKQRVSRLFELLAAHPKYGYLKEDLDIAWWNHVEQWKRVQGYVPENELEKLKEIIIFIECLLEQKISPEECYKRAVESNLKKEEIKEGKKEDVLRTRKKGRDYGGFFREMAKVLSSEKPTIILRRKDLRAIGKRYRMKRVGVEDFLFLAEMYGYRYIIGRRRKIIITKEERVAELYATNSRYTKRYELRNGKWIKVSSH